ncbi:MAG: TIGR03619 family F420-dependent LLM class oxidoreductase, partial [Chloroflexota bacterium]
AHLSAAPARRARRRPPMRVGVVVPMTGNSASATFLRDFAVRAEELGFDSLWTWERLLQPLNPQTAYGGSSSTYRPTRTIPEQQRNAMAPTEVMAGLAAWTRRARIGSGIIVMGLTNPVSLAKRLATVDILSGGRLIAGLGLGWSEDEYMAAGVEYRTRGRRSEEFIEVLTKCWAGDPVAHSGHFFQVPPSVIAPKPLQRPRPPLVLGLWSKAGLERTARYGDGWMTGGGMTLDEAVAARDWMNSLRESRQPALSVHYQLFVQLPVPRRADLTVDELVSEVARAATLGIDEVVVNPTFSRWSADADAWLGFLEAAVPALEAAHG